MKLRRISLRPEHYNRLKELSKAYEAECDNLDEARLSQNEEFLSKRVQKLGQSDSLMNSTPLKIYKRMKYPWTYPASVLCAAAAALFFIQFSRSADEVPELVNKGFVASAGIMCDGSLVQLRQLDQALDGTSLKIVATQESYLKISCEAGSFVHLAWVSSQGLDFIVKNQALQEHSEFLRNQDHILNLTALAKKQNTFLLIVSKQLINADELTWTGDELKWKSGQSPLWFEKISI
ncbi:MAG: hypothetical protein NTX25_12925, partial [Proteobacteria bacterium]|nr:hypothetical protein [Pseudomonadota bacterium]